MIKLRLSLIIIIVAMMYGCTSCGIIGEEEVTCNTGVKEFELYKDDEVTMTVEGGPSEGKLKMLEGLAYKDTLDYNKLAISVWRPPLSKDEFDQTLSIVVLEPDSYPHTYYYNYGLTNPDNDTFDYFVHGTNYKERKACIKGHSSGLVYPVIEEGIEKKSLKGYVTFDKFGEVGDFIIGSFELEFEDIKGNKRILKNGKFKIKRRPDRT